MVKYAASNGVQARCRRTGRPSNRTACRGDFCIAVVGHEGWSHDPDSTAKYAAIAVSFEVVGREIQIYEDIRVAIDELQIELQAEVEVPDGQEQE